MIRLESRVRSALLAIVLVSTEVRSTYAEDPVPGSPPAASVASVVAGPAIASLQRSHSDDQPSFVVQRELDDLIHKSGGGACASAAGIDVLQSLRVMAGTSKLNNPHKVVLTSFSDQPVLLDGRVTNEQFVRLLEFYQPHVTGKKITAAFECTPRSPTSVSGARWSEADGPELSVLPLELKVLSFTVTRPNGDVPGRHFVLLKNFAADQVTVLDPARPLKDLGYSLKKSTTEEGKSRLLLQPPPQFDRGDTFELNTVFTVSLHEAPSVSTPGAPETVESIKAKINKMVSDLRGTDDFTSPRKWREITAGFGLPGLDLPAEVGGAGWPATKMIEIFRHAGRSNLNFRDIVGGAHARPLLNSKSPKVRDIVRQVAAGKGYVAIAITEPEVGSNVSGITSTSKKVAGGYLLTGKKLYNARLEQATHIIIFTQGTTGAPGKLSVFMVPIDAPGLKIEHLTAHGLTGNSFGGLTFDRLFVPDEFLIGEDGEGLKIFFEHFLYWRLMQTAAAIGTAEDALEQMAERIKTREAFGGPIGRFTHLQQPIGQHTTELRMAYALMKDVAEMIDAGEYKTARPLICGLKAEGVEIALKAVDAATRAFGGEGYSTRVDLGDRLRDLNGLRIADGTTDVMRMEVVRWIYGREFWEMAIEARD